MNDSEIRALINLIDDPDEDIYSQIRDKLISFGEEVIPTLEDVWEQNGFGLLFQTRIEDIIHSIQFDHVQQRLSEWVDNGCESLLEGAILVAKYQYPDLDEEHINRRVQQLRQDVWIEMNDNLTAFEKVRVINQILFDIHGFSGNTSNFHAPQNSYINNVIETKKGNPLSLSILYLTIAQSLDIPVYGINLPNHFVLAYVDQNNVLGLLDDEDDDEKILFYINPFSRGSIFNEKEIDLFLKQLDMEPKDSFYLPCSNLNIIMRLLNNLVYSYEKLGYPDKINELNLLKKSLEPR